MGDEMDLSRGLGVSGLGPGALSGPGGRPINVQMAMAALGRTQGLGQLPGLVAQSMAHPQPMATPPRPPARGRAGNAGAATGPGAAPQTRVARTNSARNAAPMQQQAMVAQNFGQGMAGPGVTLPATNPFAARPALQGVPAGGSLNGPPTSAQQLQLAHLHESGQLQGILSQRIAAGQISQEQAESMST